MKWLKKMSKKGMISMGDIPTMALSAGLAVMIMAVLAIVLAAFGSSTTDGNATEVIANGQSFLTNFTAQLGTVGTIFGVMLLLGAVLVGIGGGIYGYQRFKNR